MRENFAEISLQLCDENLKFCSNLKDNFKKFIINENYLTMTIISDNEENKNSFLKDFIKGSKKNSKLTSKEIKYLSNFKGILLTIPQNSQKSLIIFELQSESYDLELIAFSLSNTIIFVIDYKNFKNFDLQTFFDQLSRIFLIERNQIYEEKKHVIFAIKNWCYEEELLNQINENFKNNWEVFKNSLNLQNNVLLEDLVKIDIIFENNETLKFERIEKLQNDFLFHLKGKFINEKYQIPIFMIPEFVENLLIKVQNTEESIDCFAIKENLIYNHAEVIFLQIKNKLIDPFLLNLKKQVHNLKNLFFFIY